MYAYAHVHMSGRFFVEPLNTDTESKIMEKFR